MARRQLANGNWVDESTLPKRNGVAYDPTAQDQATLGNVNPAARLDIAHGAVNQDDPNMTWDANKGAWTQKAGTVLNYEDAKKGFMQTAGAQLANSNRLTGLRPQTVNPLVTTSSPSGVALPTTVQRQAMPGRLGAVQPNVTTSSPRTMQPNVITSSPSNLSLKTIVDRVIPAGGAVLGGIINNRAAGNATNTLTEGGNKAIGTITDAGTAAQKHITDASGNVKTALDPYMQAGEKTLAQVLEGLQPGGGLADPFKYNPQDPDQNAAYAFRLKQGEKAIGNVQSSKGAAYSGATLKALSDYKTGQAQQFWDNDYKQQEGTFRENQRTRLAALQDIAGKGQGAAQAYAGFLTAAGGNLALIQQRTAEAVSSLQAQIASAQAAGEVDKANALTGTIESIIKQFTDAMTAQAAANAARTPATNTNTNTVTVNNNQPTITDNGDGTKTIAYPGQAPIVVPIAVPIPSPNPTTLNPVEDVTTKLTFPGGEAPDIISRTGGAAGIAAKAGGLAGVSIPGAAALTPSIAGLGAASSSATAAGIGSGSAAGAGMAVGPIAPQAAATSGAGSSALSQLATFAKDPITLAVSAAIIGTISWIKSQAHWEANTWVQGFQNKFDDKMDGINRQFGELASSGQLDRETAMAMRNATAEAMGLYEQKRQDFATKGKDNDTVARNALATFNEYYGPEGSKMLDWMDSWIASLPDPAAQATPPDTGTLGSLNPGSLMRGVA